MAAMEGPPASARPVAEPFARSVEQHAGAVREAILAAAGSGSEDLDVADAVGRALAVDLIAPIDLPGFDNSQMDGFAVRSVDVSAAPVTLPVHTTIAAGDGRPTHLPEGSATRIMTGAPVPEGADAIVPVEDTTPAGPDAVTIGTGAAPGTFIRRRGEDVRLGEVVVGAGGHLNPARIGALAALGLTTIPVRRRPRVAVIATGDELAPRGGPLPFGYVYDSNAPMLAAALRSDGAEVTLVDRSDDRPERFLHVLTTAAAVADLIVTSGGVSMGDFEVVRDVLEPRGGRFGKVAMQPGGPQGLSLVDDTPVISLPGNPVSSLVSYSVFIGPVLRELAGRPADPAATARAARDITSIAGRRQFLRGRVAEGVVEPIGGPGSHLLATMASANVLIDIPADVVAVAEGDKVRVWAI